MKNICNNRQKLTGKRSGRRWAGGFTLIELLVALSILAVVTGSIAACLAGGIRVWERARTFDTVTADAMVGLRIIEKDLMNAFSFYEISFDGKQREMSFPGLIEADYEKTDANDVPRIGTIKYFFSNNDNKKSLMRREQAYPSGSGDEHGEEIIANLGDINITYYFLPEEDNQPDAGTGVYVKKQTGIWQGVATNFPDMVKIELSLLDGESVVSVDRTVVLPVRNLK